MADKRFLAWPFFEDKHRQLARELDPWAAQNVADHQGDNVDEECKSLVRGLGKAGWLQHAVGDAIDTRAVCLIRETLARYNGLADFAFAMQGLGSGAISLQGTPEQKDKYLPRVSRGEAI